MTVAPVATEPIVASGRPPRRLASRRSGSDLAFRGVTTTVGISVLLITGSIGLFLGLQAIPTLRHYGFSFFTTSSWQPELNQIGIAAVLVGTVEIALVAVTVSVPLAMGFALFITEYAPRRLRASMVSAIDLMAAVPSII